MLPAIILNITMCFGVSLRLLLHQESFYQLHTLYTLYVLDEKVIRIKESITHIQHT